MHPEQAEEGDEDPAQVVALRSARVAPVGSAVHRRDQEQIDDPADQQQTQREKINCPADWPALIKTVRPHETEDPQDVADELAVRVARNRHIVSTVFIADVR